jgi:hypothetical protein
VNAAGIRIQRAERSLAPNVRVHPLVGEGREVGARRVLVEAVAADSGPCRGGVLVTVGRRRHRDVVERREFPAQPRPGVVLIGNGVDAQLRDDCLELGTRLRRARVQERLRERVRAAPDADPERPRVAPGGRAKDQLRARRHLVRPDRLHSETGLAGRDGVAERRGRGEAVGVQEQVGMDPFVGVDERSNDVGPDLVAHPRRRRRNQAFDVEVIRVDEEPDHRHLIVRLVGDVGEDDDPLLGGVGIDALRQRVELVGRRACLGVSRRSARTTRRRCDRKRADCDGQWGEQQPSGVHSVLLVGGIVLQTRRLRAFRSDSADLCVASKSATTSRDVRARTEVDCREHEDPGASSLCFSQRQVSGTFYHFQLFPDCRTSTSRLQA